MDLKRHYGHDTDDTNKSRTEDVLIFENVDFASMLLPSHIVEGLYSANFKRPSPIQLKAVPLARCGFDLVVQAKSGTGKTLVFGITALDIVKTELKTIQVLIIAPTREIALQVKDVISVIGSGIEGLQVKSFIGGLNPKQDKKDILDCHIAVVTPGRARQLLDAKVLKVDQLRLLVLDEADKLMEPCFSKDINRILKFASASKQIILASATLCDSVSKFIEKHMNQPMRVTATGVKLLSDSESVVPKVLLGVKQFVGDVQAPANIAQQLRKKADTLVTILKGIPFNQCIVFSNYQTRAESICNMLTGGGWPAVSICGKQDQTQRIAAVAAFKEFRCRVLLSTDLTARGLDVHGVNLVINLDVPYNAATYLHRMGRAGRFGSSGLVISLVATVEEMRKFQNILFEIGGETMAVHKLPIDVTKINDTSSLDTVVAVPAEDQNGNIDKSQEDVAGTSAVETGRSNGATKKSTPPTDGVDALCSALLETYLEPKPSFEFRSYKDLDTSRENWAPGNSERNVILNTNDKLSKYAVNVEVRKEEPIMTAYDASILKTVVEKNWSEESHVSSEVDASSESESECSERLSEENVPFPEVVRNSKKPGRKTVTVTLPESPRRSWGSSEGARARRRNTASHGRCCNHICGKDPWNRDGDFHQSQYYDHYQSQYHDYYQPQYYDRSAGEDAQTFDPSWYFSSPYYNEHRGYSDPNAQWYSNWQSQLNHIRFYVEYMEYWKNSYCNMFSSSTQDT